MAHEGSSAASRDLPLKRCRRFSDLAINEVLPDEILVQILCWLPCQSAVTCKLVCKRWLSLISTPSFISCSISRQQIKQEEKYLVLKAHGQYLYLTSQVPNSDISFSFLPNPGSSTEPSSSWDFKVKILTSSDDLFLCTRYPSSATAYFICNPFTKEWVELPLPPPPISSIDYRYVFGFTCKPYYLVEDGSGHRVLVNSSCRFRVVRLEVHASKAPRGSWIPASEFRLDVFSSETWRWTTSMMPPFSPRSLPSSCISRKEFLYWLSSCGEVTIHDPYNNKVCYVIGAPSDRPWSYSFSVSQGSLLVFNFFCGGGLRVWELEDEERDGHVEPKWRFVTSSLDLTAYMVNSPQMLDWAARPYRKSVSFLAVAFHPNDRNIVYLSSSYGGIGTLNLRTGQFKRRFVPKLATICTYGDGVVRSRKVAACEMVVFKAPCWPTPISALLNQSPSRTHLFMPPQVLPVPACQSSPTTPLTSPAAYRSTGCLLR